MGRRRKTKQAKQEKRKRHKVIILYCDESFSIEDNWIFSPSTTYEFYLRPDNFNFDVTLVVNGNGLNLNLPVNRFASFIFGSMIVGECVIMFENEVIIDFIILELYRRLNLMNVTERVDLISEVEEKSSKLEEFFKVINTPNFIHLK